MTELLVQIQQSIHVRVAAIRASRTDWPCRAGCDHCCRHLAAIPHITEAEWALLEDGLRRLPRAERNRVAEQISALEQGTRPYTCPLLDTSGRKCLVYEHRPLACRTYGFYVERSEGLYCAQIESMAEAGELDDVVWGSQANIEEMSHPLGERISLSEWFERSGSTKRVGGSPGDAPDEAAPH